MGIYLSKDGISYLWSKIKNKFYIKPSTGIPKSDLASSVQTSLGKADTALQKHQDISGKVDNTAAGADSLLSKITNSWTATPTDNTYFIRQDTSSKNEFGRVKFSTLWSYIKSKVESLGYTKNTGTITGIKMNGASKGTSGVVDLGTVITAHQDISGKQDKSTAVTHTTSTAVGSTAKPVYIAGDGKATPITHSINSDVPANAKFTDTTYSDVTETTHGLMTAEDKKKLNGLEASKFMNLNNSAIVIHGAGGTAQWYRLGTLVSSGNFNTAIIRILSGDGANGYARQNSSFEIHIKDAWQSTETASAKACGVTVYRINCANVKVKVIPTAHNTYTVWVYLPWGYWNGNYAVYGRYTSWTYNGSNQTAEPEGAAADTAYYDQAFLTSTVANATTWNGLINDVDTYNSSDTWVLVKKDNKIQHRYAGDLDVNSAKTLVDSGWQKPTFPSGVKSSSIRYRKQGKIISVTGCVQFSATQTTITVFTLPTGYRPPAKIQQFNAVDSSAQQSFLIKIDTDGKVGFFGKTRDFFATSFEYYMHCTFFVD